MAKYIKTGTTEFEQFDSHKWDLGLKEATHEYPVRGQYFRQKYEKARRKYCRKTGIYNDTTRGIYCLTQNKKAIESGDWIATGVNGEHWPVKDEVFKRTYTALPKLTKVVAQYLEYCKEHWNLNDAFLNAEYLVSDKDGAVQLDYLSSYPEDFARAWLDGYEVEDE